MGNYFSRPDVAKLSPQVAQHIAEAAGTLLFENGIRGT
jgi:hypothetical protein